MRIVIKVECEKDAIIAKAIEVMNRHLRQRGCNAAQASGLLSDHPTKNGINITLRVDTSLPSEGFRIDSKDNQTLTISGASSQGVLYGIGKMLRTASYANGEFRIGAWQGVSAPSKNVRILYLASHFHNFYHVAPWNEVKEYIEDNALRGYNGVMLWVDKHHYSGVDDPAFLEFVTRVKKIYLAAETVGMKPIYGCLANEGYNTTPDSLKATYTGRSFYGTEICPSTDEGMKLILKNHEETLQLFSGVNFGYISLWSYDQGGCACAKCQPWGSNGMLRCGREVANLFHKYFPSGKTIYSTWLFDYKGEKEWQGLDEALKNNNEPWIDYILADSHSEFPEYPLKHGVPGNRKMINFPEISMWCMYPWGALGATPLIKRFAKLWGKVCDHCDGGMPYSEGIYEDINQALYAGFYWNGDNETSETLEEYCHFELGCEYLDDMEKALDILEKNHITAFHPNAAHSDEAVARMIAGGRKQLSSRRLVAYKEFHHPHPNEALRILSAIDDRLPQWAKKAWRWRILILRATIDVELKNNDLEISDECEKCFEELADIFHSTGISEYKVSPPTRESINSFRTSQNEV